ncbi:hypothetical protein [Hasllibacter sp. MH4015]|uniref:hypothetical protein n=1 Tax=Hasllibacter sp. MH4015 TaxID=2854029 RepID=UPI001CD1E5D1|nr:hypothetical protein [Hasllibacter sp. MH4015]
MSGPKLTAMILFGALALVFGFILSATIVGAFGGFLTGLIAAAGVCALIWFADLEKLAFARGFLGLGAVFIVVPIVGLAGLGEQVSEVAVQALETGESVTEDEFGAIAITSIFASAGLVLGMIIGLILILIGGLMHSRARKSAPPPINPQ